MNVLITHSQQNYGEGAASAFDLAEALRAEGHEVLVAVKLGSALDQRITARGLQMRRISFGSGLLVRRGDLRQLRDLIWAFRPDVIHCHGPAAVQLAHDALHAAKRLVPIVITVTDSESAKSAGHDDVLIATTSRAAAQTNARETMHVLYPPVEPALYHPGRRSDHWRKQVGVGDGRKLITLLLTDGLSPGAELLLNSVPEILERFPAARFLIAARRASVAMRAIAEHVQRHPAADCIYLQEIVEDLPLLLASSDVGLVIGESDTAARSALEYLACGTPVVAEENTGAAEIIVNGETGLLANGQSRIVDEVVQILNDVAFADRALAASERLRQEHDRSRWIVNVLRVYDSAVRRAVERPAITA